MDSELPDSDMGGIFDDVNFNTSNAFDVYGSAESPFDASRFFNLSTESPDYRPRTPSKTFSEQDLATAHQQQPFESRPPLSTHSVASSSQDSVSESSSRRKRKTTSESPPTENLASLKVGSQSLRSKGSMNMDVDNSHTQRRPSRTTGNLLDATAGGAMDMNAAFDFDSAASSPGLVEPSMAGFAQPQVAKHRPLRVGNPVSMQCTSSSGQDITDADSPAL